MYSIKSSYAAILTAIFLSFLATCAKADPYFLGSIGQGQAQLSESAPGDIAWQQKGFPHSEDLKTTAYGVGVGYIFKPWLSGEVSYHDLGTISQKGQWLYNDDGSRNCSCPCYGEGSAPVKGWTLAGIARYPVGNFSIGLEAGAFKWQSAWRETIHDNQGNVSYHDPVKTSGVGALTGVVIGYKAFDLRYETFNVEPRDGIFSKMQVISVLFKY